MGLRHKFKRFYLDQHAGLSVEAVLVFPLLMWAYLGMFVLFDGYRALGTTMRATATVGDMISRETGTVTPAYLEGMNDILDVITQSPHRTVLRVSVVRYDDWDNDDTIDDDEHTLQWSYSTAGKTAIAAAEMDQKIIPYLPPIQDGGVLIVVESWVAFVPFLNVSLDAFYFEQIITTRPRFAGQVVYSTI